MQVGTLSGVRSPGMVISSALGGTSCGNSSDTSERISDVFPTFLTEKIEIETNFVKMNPETQWSESIFK